MTTVLVVIAASLLVLNIFIVVQLFKDRAHLDYFKETFTKRMDDVNTSIEQKLHASDQSSRQTFTQVIERLVRIDEAQKNIESLGSDVNLLQNVLTDKKTRGIFGEVQLKHLLVSVFGEKSQDIYRLQHKLGNGTIVDAALFLPEPLGLLAVDSKFPLENYRRMVDENAAGSDRELARKDFSKNIKKHIDDISSKYIIHGETAEQAMMFIPAEAIFAEIYAYHEELVDYALKKKVWLTSPTTLMATMSTMQMVLTNIKRSQQMSLVHEEINKLGLEFERYRERWDDLSKHMGTVNKDLDKIHTTSEKISQRFSSIVNLEHSQQEHIN